MRRSTPLALALALALALLGVGTAHAEQPTGRLIVLLDRAEVDDTKRARAAAARGVAARAGVRRTGPTVPEIGLLTVAPRPSDTLAQAARALRTDDRVASVHRERRYELRLSPNDPALSRPETAPGTPAGTPVQWWAQRHRLPSAWDRARGEDALVGVIDTGVDARHPELTGRLAELVDQGGGAPTVDENGHGTHVSALACAASGNAIGIAGAGYGCRLIVEKSDLSEASVAASIVDATNRGALAINMSFGTDGSRPAPPSIVRAVDFALGEEVVLVAAAADEPVEEQGHPANVLQATGTGPDLAAGKGLTVTAANFEDRRAPFAGRGTQISLAAYGSFLPGDAGPPGLLSAFPGQPADLEQGSVVPPAPPCECRTAVDGDERYAYLQGTSMAAPIVAASAALVRDLNPDLRAREVIRLLKETARRPAGTGWEPELGWGILDAGAAVRAASLIDRRAPTVRRRTRAVRRVRSREFTVDWSGRDRAPKGVKRSGVERYEVLRSADGRPYRRISTRRLSRLRYRGVPGRLYRFKVVATDRAGNRAEVPGERLVTVRILD